jgi:hypothetical protein
VYPIQIIIFCESEFLMLSSPNNSYNDVSPTDPSNDPSVPVEVSCQDVINSHHIIIHHQLGYQKLLNISSHCDVDNFFNVNDDSKLDSYLSKMGCPTL